MHDFLNVFKAAFAAIGAAVGFFVGGIDGFLYTLLAFIAADYVTGVLLAVKHKNLSSEVAFWGLTRKALVFVVVGIAHTLDAYILGQCAVLRVATIFFYMSSEGISLLENIAQLGVPFPEKIRDILVQIKDKGGNK
ncbi:hypothetical protein FACS189490_02060 [Clostridia bacterium]|nr:hypothetical protein FACS189490_02060 [Clostridia bacterium]